MQVQTGMESKKELQEVGMINKGKSVEDKPEPKTANNPVMEINLDSYTILND